MNVNAFKEEAREILTELESLLLELNESPSDMELINRIFGAFHTIKGTGSMFGFEAMVSFTHQVESALKYVRHGLVKVTPELVSLGLAARDKALDLLADDGLPLDDKARSIIDGFRRLCGEIGEEELAEEGYFLEDKKEGSAFPVTYRICFKPAKDIFLTGTNPLLFLRELREMGDYGVTARLGAIPLLGELDPEKCYVFWDIVLTTDRPEQEIRDVFMFVEETCEIVITPVYEHSSHDEDDYKKIGEILLDRGDISPQELSAALDSRKMIGEILVDAEIVDSENVEAVLAEQEHVRKMLKREREKTMTSMRVDSSRIDNLVDLVGELVTVQARLTQRAARLEDSELDLIAESVQRLTDELRDNAMSIRMVPIGTLFSRVRRHVHDLSLELGKQAQFTTEGAATELDKTVIDQLNEPLVHIIRNAVHHGIETADVRAGLGKSAKGMIHLAAHHEGASVVIKISDDGAGLDPAKLKAAAVSKGLVEEDDELSMKECFNLIYQAGFSTMTEANSISGRGVGMNVVKRSIDNLRGTISIDSEPGAGTTISLRLPLTLAIIDGLLVQVGREYFVLPLSVVDECVELEQGAAELSSERSMMTYRGEAITYINLRETLGVNEDAPDLEKVILVNIGGKRTGFSVDQVVGKHQTVIKTLSRVYGNVEGISGATILGDGAIALILDVSQLIAVKKRDENRKCESTAISKF